MSHSEVFWDLTFLIYRYDLPKLINKTLLFADDTSMLFAQPNLRDLNIIVYLKLNKWFKANQLPLNFDKTHYIHFVTKKDKFAKLMTYLDRYFISNSIDPIWPAGHRM
jgi:hypothetical protein